MTPTLLASNQSILKSVLLAKFCMIWILVRRILGQCDNALNLFTQRSSKHDVKKDFCGSWSCTLVGHYFAWRWNETQTEPCSSVPRTAAPLSNPIAPVDHGIFFWSLDVCKVCTKTVPSVLQKTIIKTQRDHRAWPLETDRLSNVSHGQIVWMVTSWTYIISMRTCLLSTWACKHALGIVQKYPNTMFDSEVDRRPEVRNPGFERRPLARNLKSVFVGTSTFAQHASSNETSATSHFTLCNIHFLALETLPFWAYVGFVWHK